MIADSDVVKKFVTAKSAYLRFALGTNYTEEANLKLAAYFANTDATNLEKKFEIFLVETFGSTIIAIPNKIETEAATSAMMRRLNMANNEACRPLRVRTPGEVEALGYKTSGYNWQPPSPFDKREL